MTKKLLINDLIKDKKVGAIASTSKYVVKDLIDKVDFEKAKVILEYGQGKGVITIQLLNKI